jgi:hypothetical protein
LSAIPVQIDQSRDFEIEASIKIIKGSGGLIFGMNDKYDHYRVEFNNKSDLFVVNNIPSRNKNDILLESPDNKAVKSGSVNKIKIIKYKGTHSIYVNGSLIREFKNIIPPGNKVGFNVGTNSDISVDYLSVSYLDKKTPVIPVDDNLSLNDPKTDHASVNEAAQKSDINPQITWTSPKAERVQLTSYTAKVKANITSGMKLESVMFYLNGTGLGETEIQSAGKKDGVLSYKIEKLLNLKPGENSVYFLATYEDRHSQKSPVRYFVNPMASPPSLMWMNPVEDKSSVNNDKIMIKGSITSPSGLTSAIIYVNGYPQGSLSNLTSVPATDGIYEFERNIILREGENSIYIIAENSAGTTESDKRTITYNKTLAEKRLALVIGNSEYRNGGSLKNPVNDANLIEGTLKDLGFDVLKCLNTGKDSMLNSIRTFSKKMESYNVALFYYAGHGLQVDGINYLIPTDAKLESKNDCSWEAVAVQTVTDEFKKHETNTNIVILDACRNNPFRSWMRGPEQGFKAMEKVIGTIISFATSEGETAADGIGANGLYTEELVKQMVIPQQIENVFKSTRKNVMERSRNQQVPMEWNYLIGDFYFKKQK